jgi:hypothetical protein
MLTKERAKEERSARIAREVEHPHIPELFESLRQLRSVLATGEGVPRALATLNASSEMARIVRMLKDPDEQVRKAAEQALSTLNAPPK